MGGRLEPAVSPERSPEPGVPAVAGPRRRPGVAGTRKPAFFRSRARGRAAVIGAALLAASAARPTLAQVLISALVPGGPQFTVPFTGSDIAGHEVVFLVGGALVTADDLLLDVTRSQGVGFLLQPRRGVTATQIEEAFEEVTIPGVKTVQARARVIANQTLVGVTHQIEFGFDPSPLFEATKSGTHSQLWTQDVEVYEGEPMPSELGFSWTALSGGAKEWALGNQASPIRCLVRGEAVPEGNLADLANDNSSLFAFRVAPSNAKAGTASLQFNDAPDFESPPADIGAANIYRVRIHNTHNLSALEGEGQPTGCDGSAMDLTVTVRDVVAPATVEDLSGARSNDVVTLSWAAPANDANGAPFADLAASMQITRYDYRYRALGDAVWGTVQNTTSTSVQVTVSGESHELQVRAVSAEGEGAWLRVATGPRASAPPSLEAAPGDASVRLTWDAPTNTGGFPVLEYQYDVDGAGVWTSNGTNRAVTVSNLVNDRQYTFEVRAVTEIGDGDPASVTATPMGTVVPPSAPRNLVATPGDQQITLRWDAPSSSGGGEITDYEYRWTAATGSPPARAGRSR